MPAAPLVNCLASAVGARWTSKLAFDTSTPRMWWVILPVSVMRGLMLMQPFRTLEERCDLTQARPQGPRT